MPVTLKESYGRQSFVIGKETTYGTSVAGTHRFMNMKAPFKAEVETENFAASGFTVPTVMAVNDQFTSVSADGKPDFNSNGYVFRSIFGVGNHAEEDEDVRWSHEYLWDGITELAPESYTAYYGKLGSTAGRKSTGFVFTKYGLKNSRKQTGFTAAGFGQAIQTGITMPSSPIDIAPVVMFPRQFAAYVDTSWEDLGTTKALYFMDMGFDGGDTLARVLPVNDVLTADGLTEVEMVEQSVSLTLFAGNDDAYMDKLNQGELLFIRVQATGPVLGDGTYLFQQDMAVQINSCDAYQASENVHVLPIKGTIFNDPVSGNALRVYLENSIETY